MFRTSIHLDENKNYMLGLIEFYTDNLITNVNRDIDNVFRFSVKDKYRITFPLIVITV